MTVEQFIDQYGQKPRHKKDGWLICCPYPDHQDKTPSFSVSSEGLFYCWGCHKKGNFVRLLHDIAGQSWTKANESAEGLTRVVDLNSIPLLFPRYSDRHNPEIERLSEGLLGLYEVDWEEAWKLADGYRMDEDVNLPTWTYLFRRGYKAWTLNHFGVGFDDDLQRATIPVYDINQRLAGFIGRTCVGAPKKYHVYDPLKPSTHVYNLGRVNTLHLPYILILEGAMDVWFLWQNTGRNAVAVQTSRVSEDQVNLLLKTHSYFVLLFDGDKAGKDGVLQVAKALHEKGAMVDIAMDYPTDKTDMKELTKVDVADMLSRRVPYPVPYITEARKWQ